MLSGEATNTNFLVFCLTQTGLKIMLYRTWRELGNVVSVSNISMKLIFQTLRQCYIKSFSSFLTILIYWRRASLTIASSNVVLIYYSVFSGHPWDKGKNYWIRQWQLILDLSIQIFSSNLQWFRYYCDLNALYWK